MVVPIENPIQSANMGVNPNNDGDSVKLFCPTNDNQSRDKRLQKGQKLWPEKA